MCLLCDGRSCVFFSQCVCVWSEENCGLVRDRRGTEVPFISTRGDGLGQSRSVATVERERERQREAYVGIFGASAMVQSLKIIWCLAPGIRFLQPHHVFLWLAKVWPKTSCIYQ